MGDAAPNDPARVGLDLVHLLVALIFALPIALDREKQTRLAGLRTFPLVSIASCAFVLMARLSFPDSPEAQARILQGLMTGIGFIGGGAILKRSQSVHGTSTAAGIWATALIGAAVAYERFVLAAAVSLLTYGIFRILTPIERRFHQESERRSP